MEIERRDIEGYEGYYQVSNTGLVKSLSRTIMRNNGRKQTFKERILKLNSCGRKECAQCLTVMLTVEGIGKRYLISRLVAKAFIKKLKEEEFIYHQDGNYKNNNVDNLFILKDKSTLSKQIYHDKNLNKIWYGKQIKKVSQYTLSGEYIRTFNSCKEATDYMGMKSYSSISSVLTKKRPTAYGYIRKYAE